MTKLPSLRPRDVIVALERAGFSIVRVRGSHYQLRNTATNRRVTVPYHNKDLSRATLMSILNQSGLSTEDFTALL